MAHDLIKMLAQELQIALRSHGVAPKVRALDPLNLRRGANGDDFRHGVLCCATTLVQRLASSAQGRRALAEAGFEPGDEPAQGDTVALDSEAVPARCVKTELDVWLASQPKDALIAAEAQSGTTTPRHLLKVVDIRRPYCAEFKLMVVDVLRLPGGERWA